MKRRGVRAKIFYTFNFIIGIVFIVAVLLSWNLMRKLERSSLSEVAINVSLMMVFGVLLKFIA